MYNNDRVYSDKVDIGKINNASNGNIYNANKVNIYYKEFSYLDDIPSKRNFFDGLSAENGEIVSLSYDSNGSLKTIIYRSRKEIV